MVKGTPPGDTLPPPPRRAMPARKGARCGAGAGSPRPHRPHPGHTGRGTLTARSRGRAAGGGTAPDAGRPSQHWKAPPPGTPFCQPHSEQRQPARAHAVGPVLGPRAHTDRTRDTRVAEPPQGMQAKGTVLGPHSHAPGPTARGRRTPTARSMGGQSGKGQRLTPDAPHNGGRHPPRGRPSATPTASNASQQGRTLWGRCWVPTPAPTTPGTHGTRNPGCLLQRTGGRGGDSAPHHGGRPPPPGTAPHHPRGMQPSQGMQAKGTVLGPPHPHTRAHSTWVSDPNGPPRGRAVGGGTAPDPDLRRPSQ